MSLLSFPRIGLRSKRRLAIIVRNFVNSSIEDVPEVSPSIIKRTFKAHNLTFEEGYTCFITTCTICSANSTQLSKLYVNKKTGMFMCPTCKHSGQWESLETQILSKNYKKTDYLEVNKKLEKFKESLKSIKRDTVELKTLSDTSINELLMKLNLPSLSNTSLGNLDLRVDHNQEKLYLPLENANCDIVGYRVLQSSIKNKDFASPVNIEYGGLLKGKMPRNKDIAILVPNISDFLVLFKSKMSGNIICLPNGIKTLPQYVLPTLETYKKLILWLGYDVQAWDAAKLFSKKLGEKRCYCVRPNKDHPLPHMSESQDFKSIINSAQPLWHKSITTFASLRQDVFSDLQNLDQVQGVKWKRFPTLNKILKGHRRGELTVITGPTGSGKTTFISEYSLDLAMQGVSTLWGSFEIRNARLARTMLQQMVGIPLDENLHLFDAWADDFEQLPIYYMTFHGQQTIKVVMEAVEHATYVNDITHVIIDNVQFMMGISEDQRNTDRFWKQDSIIAAFRSFATKMNCHVSLVIHPRKEKTDEDLTTNSIFGGAKATQEADNVLIIQDKRLVSIKGKKYLQISKNRFSGDLGIIPLEFDKLSLSFAPKKRKKAKEEKNDDFSETNIENRLVP